LAVLANHARPPRCPAPPGFRVVAILKTHNEADLIAPSIMRLVRGGIDVYVVDNWSTDGTYEIAERFSGRGVIGLERFPAAGRGGTYHWRPLLERTEELAATLPGNWFVHHDADEYRESPFAGLTLRDGLWYADACGFNAVDFTVVNFSPVDDGYVAGTDFVPYFRHWSFGDRSGHFVQVKAWKQTGQRVCLAASGGHVAEFEGRRVFPYKCLLRHYPFRTRAQAQRKVHEDRVVHPEERGRMNTHYDLYRDPNSVMRDPATLPVFDTAFAEEFMVERLTGIGIRPRS
jgi:hypothetical protein